VGIKGLSVRIGINSGRVAIGPVGGANEVTLALGDAVNVAARVQALAEPGTIAVGSVAADALSDRFELRSLGSRT